MTLLLLVSYDDFRGHRRVDLENINLLPDRNGVLELLKVLCDLK